MKLSILALFLLFGSNGIAMDACKTGDIEQNLRGINESLAHLQVSMDNLQAQIKNDRNSVICAQNINFFWSSVQRNSLYCMSVGAMIVSTAIIINLNS